MKRKADLDSDTKSSESKKSKKLFTASDFNTLLSDSSSAFTGLASFITAVVTHLEDRTEDDVVQSYCKSTSDCKKLLDLLSGEKLKTQETFQVLESIRLILSRIFSDLKQYEIVGQSVAKKLVANHVPAILRQTSIGNKSLQVKSALKLLTLLTSGTCSTKWPWIAKEVVTKIDFNHANWTALINRKDAKDPEDVKYCLMEFLCNLISSRNLSLLKILMEAKTFMSSIIDSLHGDSCFIISKFLETIHFSIINNTTLTKTFKIRLFNERSLKSLVRLYNWTGSKTWQEMNNKKDKLKNKNNTQQDNTSSPSFDLENLTEEQELVRSHVHKVLVQLCSSFRNGIIFKDKSTPIISGQNPNHVITHLLQNLPQSFYKDPLTLDLALKIFSSCSDQLHFFLGTSSFAGFLQPRISKNWFACCEFVTEVFRGQKFTPRTFPLFLLSGDPQKMGENYVRHVLPPTEIWRKLMGGLLEQHDDQITSRCLDFISINTERLVEAKQHIQQQKLNNTDLYNNNKHFYQEFEDSFNNGIKKNIPSFDEMVSCMDKFICKEKVEEQIDGEKEDDKGAKDNILKELPAINEMEVIGKFLQVMRTLSCLGDKDGDEDGEHLADETSNEKIIGTVCTLLHENAPKNKKTSSDDDDDVQKSSSNHVKTLLLHFWRTIIMRGIPLMKFVQEPERNIIIQTTLELLAGYNSRVDDDDDDDDDLSHVMLLDVFSEVLMGCGVFESLDEIRSWLRNLKSTSESKKSTKKSIKFFLASLVPLVGLSGTKSSDLSLFLRTSLEKRQDDKVIDAFVDNCVFDIVATSVDPLGLSTILKQQHKQDGRLPKSRLVIEFLTSDKWKKKSKNNEFKVDLEDETNQSDPRVLQHQIKMTCFASSVEAFKISKTQSPDVDKLNSYLEKLTASIKDMNALRSKECEDDDDEEDEEELGLNTIRKVDRSKQTEFCDMIFKETCTFLFSKSFLQTFFLGRSAASFVVNEWFASMAEKLPHVLDDNTLEVVLDRPIKKIRLLLGESRALENQLMRLVRCFSSFVPVEQMKEFCLKFILDDPEVGGKDENDIQILTDSGLKFLSANDVHNHEDFLIRISQYLRKRITKVELTDNSLNCSFAFILKFIKHQPSQGPELLISKKNSFFTHLVSSSQKIKLNFIMDLMKDISSENVTFLAELLSNWLKNNEIVWKAPDNWSKYAGILVEFVRCSKGDDITKNVGHHLWSQVVQLVCSGAETNEEDSDFVKFVLEATENLFEMFGDKMTSKDIAKTISEHWSKFVKTGLKHHLMNKSFVNILSSIIHEYVIRTSSISLSSLHPSIPDVFNMVIGHSMFMKVITMDSNSLQKESIFKLLHTLATASQGKCCAANLVPLLFGAFSATLSTTDKCILSLLHMSEKNGSDILQHKPYYWGQKAVDYQASKKVLFANVLDHGLNELVDQVDPKMMMDAALNFPFSGKLDYSTYSPFLEESTYVAKDKELHKIYNPLYFLPLFHHLIDKKIDCRKFVERNCLGMVMASLTSHEKSVRNLGAMILVTFRGHLESSKFIDKQQVMYMMDALQNGIEGDDLKLSSVVSVFLVRAANILLRPNA